MEPNLDAQARLSAKRRRYMVLAIVLAVVVGAVFVSPLHAGGIVEDAAENLVNWIVALFTKILVYIMELLGYILIQLVDLLIQIVQFNNFVKASPVRIGWPLMRDTVNMFFIIVVLITAFSTIIGYQEFHYRKILPKLLLMAILINFSKTLIGLMIDFSQVVVLTFVNGFKAAAGGNFISALHITEAMNIESSTGDVVTQDAEGVVHVSVGNSTGVSIYQIFNMLLAAIFGIWMLSIAITLIVIMLIFFLARIIILWFLLITSPVMFFAWALPSKLQKAFAAFTDQWWQRLSSALIGGPVMAFFLWLSLAIAQGSSGPDSLTGTSSESSLYRNASTETQNVVTGLGGEKKLGDIVVTKIGKPENFANFIIMVAFMLLGVQVAVQSSQALAPKLGALAGAVSGAGGAAGVGVALVAAGAQAGGRGASWAGGKAEERFGLKAKLAGGTLGLAQKTGIPLTMGMRTGLATAAAAPQRAAVKRAAELKTAMGFLPPAMQMKEWESLAGSRIAKKADKIAAVQNMTSLAKSSTYMKDQQKQETEEIRKEKYGGRSDEKLTSEERLAMNTEARARVDAKVAEKLQTGHDFAVANNMTELMDEIKKAREENPALFAEIDQIDSVAAKMASDPEAERKMKDDSFMNMAFTLQYLKGRGFMNEKGNLTVDPIVDDNFKNLMRGRQGHLIAATLDYVQNTEEGRQKAQTILDPNRDKTERQGANVVINSNADDTRYSVVAKQGADKTPTVVTYDVGGYARQESQILGGITNEAGNVRTKKLTEAMNARSIGGKSIESIGRRLGTNKRADDLIGLLNTEQTGSDMAKDEARMTMLQNGLMDPHGMYGINDKGDFANDEAEEAFVRTMSKAFENVKAGNNAEMNMRVIVNGMSNVKGAALARGGQVMRAAGYQALRNGMDAVVGEQRKLFSETIKNMMNEAALAAREQASGGTLSAAQKDQVSNVEWIKGIKASKEDKAVARAAVNFARGKETNIHII